MSEIELSTDILNWINEESSHSISNSPASAISIKLLILRLALKNQESQDTDLTQSTELSLQAYERASLFRTLMHLNKRGLVSFVSNAGKPLAANEINQLYPKFMSGSVMGEVCLTKMGLQEMERLKAFEKLSDRQEAAKRFDLKK